MSRFAVFSLFFASSFVFAHEIEFHQELGDRTLSYQRVQSAGFAKSLTQSVRQLQKNFPSDQIKLFIEGPKFEFALAVNVAPSAENPTAKRHLAFVEIFTQLPGEREDACTFEVMNIMPKSRRPHCYGNKQYFHSTAETWDFESAKQLSKKLQRVLLEKLEKRTL